MKPCLQTGLLEKLHLLDFRDVVETHAHSEQTRRFPIGSRIRFHKQGLEDLPVDFRVRALRGGAPEVTGIETRSTIPTG